LDEWKIKLQQTIRKNQNNELASFQAGSLLELPRSTGQNDDDDKDVDDTCLNLLSGWIGAGITEVVFT